MRTNQALRDGKRKGVAPEYKASALRYDLYPIIATTIIYGREHDSQLSAVKRAFPVPTVPDLPADTPNGVPCSCE